MSELIPVLDKKEIENKVLSLAHQISIDYQAHDLILIGILKGAFVFLADLMRHLNLDSIKIDFMRVASYGSGTTSSQKISLIQDISLDIENKHVLIVEDIVDTGLTLDYIVDHLKSFNPKTIKICAFIDKKERRKIDIKVDYACHKTKQGFLVGYGLDHAENYRNLAGLYHLKQ